MRSTPETPLVVLVEDNEDDADLARRAFARAGVPLELLVVPDGVAALELLLADGASERPALLLLDLRLPGVSGLGVLGRLRTARRTRWLPIVVLTTSLEEADLREAYHFGANSYLRKPVDYQEFEDMVRHVARYWLQLNHLPPVEGT